MTIIKLILEILGLGWAFLFIIIGILGGSVDIKIVNPVTKKFDTLTDITINHNKLNK